MNEKTKEKKASRFRLFDLVFIIFGITYMLTIVFFTLNMRFACLVCFIAQSFSTVFILLRSTPADTSPAEDLEEITNEKQIFEAHQAEVTRLHKEINEKEIAIERLESRLAESRKDADALNQTISDLNAEIEQNQDPYLQEKYITLLPRTTDYDEKHPSIDLIHLVAEVIEEFEEDAKNAGIQIQLSSACSSLNVKTAPSRIRVLFRNIIDNSIKYMKQSGRLVITISNIGTDIFIVLKDNGKGLSRQETDHIFELNYQGSNRISGNGLGLAQSKAIVEYYGGTIYAKSSENLGMAIYIQLPSSN